MHNIPYTTLETSDGLILTDPLGNSLQLVNSPHPFSTSSTIDPSENSVASLFRTQSLVSLDKLTEPKKKIAVLTSGGDSQGMNCAVRGVIRTAIAKGCEAYAVLEGYQGLVDGGNKIVKMGWNEVRKFVSISGTVIGTARCQAFRTLEGRLKGAENLIKNGIDGLVVIGGDGSLTGADLFRSEWPELLTELLKQNRITLNESEKFQHLNIVGLVGSIDNDMAGTDFTIGAISSLHRICESVDNITSTALSHQRVFVIEVMGRHCGWLALMSAVCTGADFVLIPEQPLGPEEWKEKMCKTIKRHRDLGRRDSIVIVCEGATDNELKPIKSEEVAAAIKDKLGLDPRITYLGHIQRGGNPASQDRVLGTVQGVQAVEVLLKATPKDPSMMIGMRNNHIQPVPLMEAVKLTKKLASLVEAKQFDAAMDLRDPAFKALWDAYCHSEYNPEVPKDPEFKKLRIGIMNVGAPAGGMNAAVRTISRLAINHGHTPLAIRNGFNGLMSGEVVEISWLQPGNWMPRGGSELGTNRDLPEVDHGQIAYQLQKQDINCLFIVGGFEAYKAVNQLLDKRNDYPAYCIPIAFVPATISNNVPGTDYSLGCDTALNAITEACDRITLSANASHSRVFVVEVQGGRSGFLATLAGISVGASKVYIPEEGITLNDLAKDVEIMKKKFSKDLKIVGNSNVGRIVLKTDEASKTYKTEFISDIYQDEGKLLFDSRTSVLGHIQQGGSTSPVDRMHAMIYAHRSFFWLLEQFKGIQKNNPMPLFKGNEAAVVVGNREGELKLTNVKELNEITDWVNRRPTVTWWRHYSGYNRMLAHYGKD
ncbi:6-phosphofructokinase [Neoconidiobolus thromboides FSU 785]|nr:6-phosphofructokinase [Neoconidiobolus thromboides FSU 785]